VCSSLSQVELRKSEAFLYSVIRGELARQDRILNIDVGQIIAGKYELVRLLGKGAMGEVWLATHNSLGGEFAIKLVEPTDDIEAETAAGRFQLEAQIAAKLSRKTRHIVSVSDHGEENGLAYLVMELLEGESLEAKTKRVGHLEMPEVAAIVTQVARALSLAHEEGIFHRDLKPANVWLARDEDGRLLVKLLDFGIARSQKPFRTRSPFATSKDMVLGTPSYMSPEQARGLESLDYRCDLWALAVVAYEALTRKIPFEGETVEDIFLSICTFRVIPALTRRPDLPPMIEAFFARAFAPKLDDRFRSAAELTESFESLVSPEELEVALGIPLTPMSVRRLEAARASNPSFASSSNLNQYAPKGDPRRSAPDFDPDGGPSVDPMSVALGHPSSSRRGGMGWLIAIAGLIALLGVGVLVLVSFRGGNGNKTVAGSPTEPASTSVTTPPPTNTVATATTTITTATTPAIDSIDVPDPAPTAKSSSAAQARPKVSGTRPGGTAASVSTQPTGKPSTPAPARSVNKADVF
jgi:serine/threonine-protein kinase